VIIVLCVDTKVFLPFTVFLSSSFRVENAFFTYCRIFRHTFLKIHYGAGVDVKPNLIEGDSLLKTFSAGYYHARGQPLGAGLAVDSTPTITVRPISPFPLVPRAGVSLRLYI